MYIVGDNNFWYATGTPKNTLELRVMLNEVREGIAMGEYENNDVGELYVVQGREIERLTTKELDKMFKVAKKFRILK